MTDSHAITYIMFLIFAGTAVLSTLALFTRQSLLVAYIVLGAVLGPWGLQLLKSGEIITQAGDIGILFLLFLLGMHLQPQNLFHSLRKMSLITLVSSLIFFGCGFLIGCFSGYGTFASVIIGITAMFSSTIIGIKLLPTTILHHQHTGEVLISVLLLQDIIAIASMLAIKIMSGAGGYYEVGMVLVAFPVLLIVAYLFQRYILSWLLAKFDKIHEYIFILSVGWCLSMAELAHLFGLSGEIGAFIAGVSLASNPISFYIAESLKPLRDFFLVIFFFSIGAGFNFGYFNSVIIPALILAGVMLAVKPVVYALLLKRSGEVSNISWEIGIRLGQMSEFSLLVIYMALATKLVPDNVGYMAQAAVIITFFVSCYWTVLQYPTPLASSDKLRRD